MILWLDRATWPVGPDAAIENPEAPVLDAIAADQAPEGQFIEPERPTFPIDHVTFKRRLLSPVLRRLGQFGEVPQSDKPLAEALLRYKEATRLGGILLAEFVNTKDACGGRHLVRDALNDQEIALRLAWPQLTSVVDWARESVDPVLGTIAESSSYVSADKMTLSFQPTLEISFSIAGAGDTPPLRITQKDTVSHQESSEILPYTRDRMAAETLMAHLISSAPSTRRPDYVDELQFVMAEAPRAVSNYKHNRWGKGISDAKFKSGFIAQSNFDAVTRDILNDPLSLRGAINDGSGRTLAAAMLGSQTNKSAAVFAELSRLIPDVMLKAQSVKDEQLAKLKGNARNSKRSRRDDPER